MANRDISWKLNVVLKSGSKNIFLLLCLLTYGCGSTNIDRNIGSHGEVVLADMGWSEEQASNLGDGQLALLIRELVYSNNVLPQDGEPSTDFEPSLDFFNTYELWVRGEAKFLCAGISHTLAWILEEVGVPARVIHLATQNFLDGTAPLETHVTTEAFIEGRWVVMDGTFNASFQCEGSENLSILELQSCWKNNRKVNFTTGLQLPSRRLDEYVVPFENHLAAYAVNAYYVSSFRNEPFYDNNIPDFPASAWYE